MIHVRNHHNWQKITRRNLDKITDEMRDSNNQHINVFLSVCKNLIKNLKVKYISRICRAPVNDNRLYHLTTFADIADIFI